MEYLNWFAQHWPLGIVLLTAVILGIDTVLSGLANIVLACRGKEKNTYEVLK